jgi:hypothetical protein
MFYPHIINNKSELIFYNKDTLNAIEIPGLIEAYFTFYREKDILSN